MENGSSSAGYRRPRVGPEDEEIMRIHQLLKAVWNGVPRHARSRLDRNVTFRLFKNALRKATRTHDDTYGLEGGRGTSAERSAGPIAERIVQDLGPATVLDVGCGAGALLAALRARGVLVEGLEYSSDRLKRCQERELPVHRFDLESGAEPPIAEVFDVVISLEVAEHLPPAVADRFVDLLAGRARRTVVFSAATPGQGGVDHVNEQPHRYWIERFEKRGFRFDEERSRAWRDSWHGTGVAWWYRRNLMLFHR
jgi:2-polyprenyl-3-methyl-5-hydroxy-6-metoxy-1,4-benzoquinol methylase